MKAEDRCTISIEEARKLIGKYQCCKCNFYYEKPVEPGECPRCGHLWVHWLNYEELNEKYYRN